MADTKITALTAITTVDPANDVLPIVDVSDTSMAASGTTKKITTNQILGASGTATLASATISGDLTVDTSTLKVDSANHRVGIGTASPGAGYALDVVGAARITAANGLVIDKAGAGFVDFFNSGNAGANVGTSGTGGLVIYTANGVGGAYGVRHTIAGDGVATWSNVGGVAGTAMTLNSTGLGVGTSPTNKLDVSSSDAAVTLRVNTQNAGASASNYSQIQLSDVGTVRSYWRNVRDGAGTTQFAYNSYLQFLSDAAGTPTERMRIDSSGNVGIGVTPSAWRSTNKALQVGSYSSLTSSSAGDLQLFNNAYINSGGSNIYQSNGFATRYEQYQGVHAWYTAPSGTAGNTATFTQAMTLDASGNLLIGQTASTNGNLLTGYAFNYNSGASQFFIGHQTGTASGTTYEGYSYNGTLIGSITQSGTTGVAFNATSDYRLKEAVQPITGALNRIAALKPSIYKWKVDGSSGEGFLAHELAEAVPLAVTGEKDAVNEDGSIKPQQVDLSKVVPVLVAAIQELAAEVNALKNA